MERLVKLCPLFFVLVFIPLSSGQNYKDALTKSILYYENQRSGPLPGNQRVLWRGDSALNDGKQGGVDLVGGYYDAGDNVKFGLPMAFTITMLSWGIVEYSKQLAASGELNNALQAVKWGTDYLIKAHPAPYVLYGQVGDGYSDHACWQRPEDMNTSRTPYKIDAAHPGSELAGETAAAMAAASIAFSASDSAYANKLRGHAFQLFDFATKYRGNYDKSIPAAPSYPSFSGFNDELLWAAAWCYKASKNPVYLDFLGQNGDALGGTTKSPTQFTWDDKTVGLQTFAAEILMDGQAGKHAPTLQKFQSKAEEFMCKMVGDVRKTPGGLIYIQEWNNLQYVVTASFVTTVYADRLTAAKKQLNCGGRSVSPNALIQFAKSQVDYILGKNPNGMSYMVGYSNKFPQRVHHRGASIVSIKKDPRFVSCSGGYDKYFKSPASNPNMLTGAVVGGPDANDRYQDSRGTFTQAEPCTVNNAPLVGVLARLNIG